MTVNEAISPYNLLLQNEEWFSARRRIIERDQFRCRHCGSSLNLQVHHRQYHKDATTGKFVMPWDYKDNYLITFCQKCHKTGHEKFIIPVFTIKIKSI